MFNQALPMTVEKPIADVLNYSLTTLVKYYDCEEKHVEHVVNLNNRIAENIAIYAFNRSRFRSVKAFGYSQHNSKLLDYLLKSPGPPKKKFLGGPLSFLLSAKRCACLRCKSHCPPHMLKITRF